MNLVRDLQKLRKERALKESAVAQLRKRSKDSIARPRSEKNSNLVLTYVVFGN